VPVTKTPLGSNWPVPSASASWGFEILTAPFAIAQLQLYLLLDELGSTPDEAHRVAVLLTNALSGWHDAGDIKLNFPEKGGIRCLAKGKARGEDHCHPWQSSL
jgi:hypothetical protein